MTVERFRDVSEMPPPMRVTGARLFEHIIAAWQRAHLGGPPVLPRGVFRFASIEQAQAAREAWTKRQLTHPRKT